MFDIAIECMFIPILKRYSVFCIFITIFCILHFYNNILYFVFLFSFYLGEKVALFWIAWAFVAEKVENFKLTDQIFQKVKKYGAVLFSVI